MSDIADRIHQIRERVAQAARRSGRNPDEIMLMAVSKTHSPQSIISAYQAGIRIFGESRVQEFGGKFHALQPLKDARWILIGHLQSNKANKAAVATDDATKITEAYGRTVGSLQRQAVGVQAQFADLAQGLEAWRPMFSARPIMNRCGPATAASSIPASSRRWAAGR